MLPEWDFGDDDSKRQAFIEWVWAELDRFADMTSTNDPLPSYSDELVEMIRAGATPAQRQVGRPVDAFAGMNAMVWEFGLLRFMFALYWPDRKRSRADRASAANIAVARCQRALPVNQRTPDRQAARQDLARRVYDERERGSRSPGRQKAESDIAFLKSLPASRFAR